MQKKKKIVENPIYKLNLSILFMCIRQHIFMFRRVMSNSLNVNLPTYDG